MRISTVTGQPHNSPVTGLIISDKFYPAVSDVEVFALPDRFLVKADGRKTRGSVASWELPYKVLAFMLDKPDSPMGNPYKHLRAMGYSQECDILRAFDTNDMLEHGTRKHYENWCRCRLCVNWYVCEEVKQKHVGIRYAQLLNLTEFDIGLAEAARKQEANEVALVLEVSPGTKGRPPVAPVTAKQQANRRAYIKRKAADALLRKQASEAAGKKTKK